MVCRSVKDPKETGIRCFVNCVEKIGSVDGRLSYQHIRSACTCKNTIALNESVRQGPTTTTRRRSQQL